MPRLSSILLLVGAATAQLTTSFWQLNIFFETMSIGYEGSVVGVDGDRTTLAVAVDDDADPSRIAVGYTETVTIGPDHWEMSTSRYGNFAHATQNSSDEWDMRMACSKGTEISASVDCTASYGPSLALQMACPNPAQTGLRTTELVYTWADEATEGSSIIQTTTVTTTFSGAGLLATMDRPWCSSGANMSAPASFRADEMSFPHYNAATYKLVITAGEEKLSATTGAGAPTGPEATGTNGQPTGTEGSPEETGAATKMNSVPALAGLGAAVAAFML